MYKLVSCFFFKVQNLFVKVVKELYNSLWSFVQQVPYPFASSFDPMDAAVSALKFLSLAILGLQG